MLPPCGSFRWWRLPNAPLLAKTANRTTSTSLCLGLCSGVLGRTVVRALLFWPAFFQTGAAKYSVKKQWLARRNEIRYLYNEADRKCTCISAHTCPLGQLSAEAGALSVLNSPHLMLELSSLRLVGLPRRCESVGRSCAGRRRALRQIHGGPASFWDFSGGA